MVLLMTNTKMSEKIKTEQVPSDFYYMIIDDVIA